MKSRNIVVFVLVALTLITSIWGCSGSSAENKIIGQERTPNGNKLVGKLVGGEITVSAATDDQQNPQVIYLADKKIYFVVWEDWRNRNQSATDDPTKFSGSDIWGKFINPDGTNCTSEFPITNKSFGNQTLPQAAYRPGDKIVVTWQDAQGDSTAGYVKYVPITNIPSFNTITNVCSGSTQTVGTASSTGYTGLKDYERGTNLVVKDGPVFLNHSSSAMASVKLGASSTPVIPGTLKIRKNPSTIASPVFAADLADGTLTGILTGTVNYITGSIEIKWDAAAGNHDYPLDVYYDSFSSTPGDHGDQLLSRKSPKIVYDPVRDEFWFGWIESRDVNSLFSTECWGVPFTWVAGDSSFAGYLRLNGSNLSIKTNGNGIAQADLLRNEQTSTSRIISTASTDTTITRTYEYFTSINNVSIASDDTSPETLFAWEGNRQKGVLACTLNKTTGAVASTFTISDQDDGQVHIYGLFDKEILLGSLNSKWIDFSNTSSGTNSSIAVDNISNPRKFLFAWEDNRDGSSTKVYGQLVNSGGGLYNINKLISFSDYNGSGIQDPTVANSRQTRPAVSYDSVNQRYFVAWQDSRNGTTSTENMDIYGQYVDMEGTLRGGNYAITTQPGSQVAPSIAYDSLSNQFLAVWKDARSVSTGSGTAADVYGQRFSLGQPQMTLLNLDNTPFTPPLLDFGTVTVGTSVYKSFKVRNTGDIALNITSVTSPSAEFAVTPQAAAQLAPSAEQTFTVTYTPINGSSNSSFVINSDASDATINLSGLGVAPSLTASSGNINFSNTDVGQNATTNLTLTNTGTTPVMLTSISGALLPFSTTNTPTFPQSIAAGNSLTFAILFAPTQAGSFSSTISILTNMASTDQTIQVSGIGIKPNITSSTSILDFGTATVGTSKQLTFTISNTGNKVMNVNSMTVGGSSAFTVVTPVTSTFTVAAGSSQSITMQFNAAALNAYAGTLSIISDGGDRTITLQGQGTAGILIASPSQIDFGTVALNSVATKTVTLTNTGNAPLNISGITAPANALFSVSYIGALPVQLLPNTSFTVTITFQSGIIGLAQSSFAINTDASNGNQTVNLQAVTSSLSITTTILPACVMGDAYNQTLFATGGAQPYTWSLVTPNGGTLPSGISLNSSTGIIKGTPSEAGNYVFVMNVTDKNGLAATQTLSINVTGGGTVSSTVLFQDVGGTQLPNAPYSLGNQFIGLSVTRTLRVLNNSTSPIVFSGASIANTAYSTTFPTLQTTLAPNNTITFDVTFIPQAAGSYPASLVLSDTNNGTYSLPLAGTGTSVNVVVNTTTQPAAVVSNYAVLTSQQISIANKPTNYTFNKAVDTVVNGVATGGTVTIMLTYDSLPANPVFYEVSNNIWTKITPTSIIGRTVTYNVTDNDATADSSLQNGVVHNTIVVGTQAGSGPPVVDDPSTTAPASGGGGGGSGCFIATAAYGSYLDPHVMVLRHFRDDVLLQSDLGTVFVHFYYKYSPPIADFIAQHDTLRMLFRFALTPLIFGAEYPLAAGFLFTFAAACYVRRRLGSKAQTEIVQQAG